MEAILYSQRDGGGVLLTTFIDSYIFVKQKTMDTYIFCIKFLVFPSVYNNFKYAF